MKTIRVELGQNGYPVHVGQDVRWNIGRWLNKAGYTGKVIIITNPLVKELHGDGIGKRLAGDGFQPSVVTVPDGEEFKTLESAGKLYLELSSLGAERATPIIAVGGGVIGDLAGFVAATYQRGVPLVQVPTTLLAQVDSSVGGKTAVDHGMIKNRIGAFYQPKFVVADVTTLGTLPAGEVSNGLAEVIKYSVIADRQLLGYLEVNIDRIRSCEVTTIEDIVARSVKTKAGFVEKDERDLGLRNVLNFGHTLGHAIESASDFKVKHGEAVAVGMVAASRIAMNLGLFKEEELSRLRSIIDKAGLPTSVPSIAKERILTAMRQDKKIRDGKVRFILPTAIGKVVITDTVSGELMEQALTEVQ